jgi:MFS family permease
MTGIAAPVHGAMVGATRANRSLRLARASVAALFFINGAGTANWLVRIPAVQAKLGLSEGALGVALLGVAVGALVAMPRAGHLVARYGSRPVTRVGAVLFGATLLLPPLAPNPIVLVLALVALGAAHGSLDVAMNAQAATVERRYGRPIMAGFHALWSAGGLVGSAIGGFVAQHRIGPAPHLITTAVVAGILAIAVTGGMLPAAADADITGEVAPARPRGILLTLGVMAFCVLLGEGAMADWSALYLRDITGAAPGIAAAGYAAFSLAMAAGRFAGDALTLRFGATPLVRGGGLLAAAGLLFALVSSNPWAAVVGFGAVGAGFSVSFPLMLAKAGSLSGTSPGTAIATVSVFGYAGFLAGPPLIGFVSQATTLRGGLAVVVVTSLIVAALAGGFRRSASGAAPPTATAIDSHLAA